MSTVAQPGVAPAISAADGPSEAPGGIFSSRMELRAAILAGILLFAGYVFHTWLKFTWAESLFWLSLAIGFLYGGRAAWDAVREKKVDIDVLMIVGAGLAASIGHPEEGALLLFLFVLSGALEDRAMERTRREIEALHKLMPGIAIVKRGEQWVEVAPESLVTRDVVRIRPGDRVPVDCRITSGRTSIDQSAITGESMPRDVKEGDDLYAGTINSDDPVEAVVLRPASESSLQRILNLVTSAREQREPVQRVIDRLSQPYATSVLVVSTLLFFAWWGMLDRPWRESLYFAITLLVVASPCALIIATPTATLAAIARAAKAGVLFKGGQSIERLANIGSVCFDKTGTLTIGRPIVHEVHPVAWSDGRELLAVAAGLEASSTHPIAAAVLEAAKKQGVEPAKITEFNHTTGRGVGGSYGGAPARLGSFKFTQELIPVCFRARVQEVLEKIQQRGQLGVVIAVADPRHEDGGQAAVIIMADSVRPGAPTLVKDLHAIGVRPVRMLTGDNRLTAASVAKELGIDRFDAECLPEDKVRAVSEMKSKDGKGGVGVIGDGVNDAPALAAADVSIAIGSIGSDAALESADIVLLSDDLGAVPWAVRLARRARATVKVNLIFALSIIVLMAIATVIGSLLRRPVQLSVGVLAHEGGTLLVVLNSLRLIWFRAPARSGRVERAGAPGAHDSHDSTPGTSPHTTGADSHIQEHATGAV